MYLQNYSKYSMSIFANAGIVNHVQNRENEEFQKEYSVAKERFIGRKHFSPSLHYSRRQRIDNLLSEKSIVQVVRDSSFSTLSG